MRDAIWKARRQRHAIKGDLLNLVNGDKKLESVLQTGIQEHVFEIVTLVAHRLRAGARAEAPARAHHANLHLGINRFSGLVEGNEVTHDTAYGIVGPHIDNFASLRSRARRQLLKQGRLPIAAATRYEKSTVVASVITHSPIETPQNTFAPKKEPRPSPKERGERVVEHRTPPDEAMRCFPDTATFKRF